jgi:hypothetical protein
MENLDHRIVVGITGSTTEHWQNKLAEINKLGITRAALFVEQYLPEERQRIYAALDKSCLKEIPLIHIRKEDMPKEELKFLCEKYNNPYLTIHENEFEELETWSGLHKHLFLEMNYDNFIPENVDVKKIGGFCVDLSHFKAAEEKWTKEFEYMTGMKKHADYFACNHINGYSYTDKRDIHTIESLDQFDYLKTLPEFLFGKTIAIETYNSIAEQLEFKKYLIKSLS